MQRLGFLLVGLGAAALVWAGVQWQLTGDVRGGGLAASGLFLVILGFVFLFPTMLTDDTGATSTMRVAVFMVVSLFVVLTTKAGWAATSLADLKLQDSWVWVLGAALGGKAFQSFAENTTGPTLAKSPALGTVAAHMRDEREGIQDAP
jgi:hypothetical protein